jgi:histone deacetylase 1/2
MHVRLPVVSLDVENPAQSTSVPAPPPAQPQEPQESVPMMGTTAPTPPLPVNPSWVSALTAADRPAPCPASVGTHPPTCTLPGAASVSPGGPASTPHAPPGGSNTTTATKDAVSTDLVPASGSEEHAILEPVSHPAAHPYGTRLQHNICKPKQRTDGTVTYSAVWSSDSAPTSHIVALNNPLWRRAMDDEYRALIKNATWHLVPPRPGLNVIDCKWVFKIKQKPDGSVDRYKARLVAKVFKQQFGVDYDATFSPVVKPTTIRLLLSLVVSCGWLIRQIDIQNAFLHCFLDEDIYI